MEQYFWHLPIVAVLLLYTLQAYHHSKLEACCATGPKILLQLTISQTYVLLYMCYMPWCIKNSTSYRQTRWNMVLVPRLFLWFQWATWWAQPSTTRSHGHSTVKQSVSWVPAVSCCPSCPVWGQAPGTFVRCSCLHSPTRRERGRVQTLVVPHGMCTWEMAMKDSSLLDCDILRHLNAGKADWYRLECRFYTWKRVEFELSSQQYASWLGTAVQMSAWLERTNEILCHITFGILTWQICKTKQNKA